MTDDNIAARYRNEETLEEVLILHDMYGGHDPMTDEDHYFEFLAMDHRNYSFGHEQFSHAEDLKERVEEVEKEGGYAFPVYMYEHSGVAFSLGRQYPFNYPWDSGQIGFIVITEETRAVTGTKDFGHDRFFEMLEGFIEYYNHYLMGNVYGYVCRRFLRADEWGEREYEDLDSCFGFIGWADDGNLLSEAGVMRYEGEWPDGEFVMNEGWVEA